MRPFEPQLIGFLCNWCAYEGADAAGRSRRKYPAGFKAVRVMCSGRVDLHHILEAFGAGADGVLILGCPHGSCHYKSGNVEVLKRVTLVDRTLRQFGFDSNRLALDWVSAGEGEKFAKIVETMFARLKQMGPLNPR